MLGTLFGLAFLLGVGSPSAASVEGVETVCEAGSDAGQCLSPAGIASDGEYFGGRIYLVDQGNERLVQMTDSGVFTQASGWGVRDGSPELQTCDWFSGCGPGVAGGLPGQVHRPQGLAIGDDGDIYVVDHDNHRVTVFIESVGSGESGWRLTFGRNVNRTAIEEGRAAETDICPAAKHPADNCQAGAPGTGPGQFGAWGPGSYIAFDRSAEILYVGDAGRIQEFTPDGVYLGEIPLPGEVVQSLAVDSAGALLVALSADGGGVTEPGVMKLSPDDGELECTLDVGQPTAISTDPDGNAYVVDAAAGVALRKFASDCSEVTDDSFPIETDLDVATGLAFGVGCHSYKDLFVSGASGGESVVRQYVLPPSGDACVPEPPPHLAIREQAALLIGPEAATVSASINPAYDPETTYYVEYGLFPCAAAEPCESRTLFPGAPLGSGGGQFVRTPDVLLDQLKPATTYHFRFVATNYAGSVFGEGWEETGGSFTTLSPPVEPEKPVTRATASASISTSASRRTDTLSLRRIRTLGDGRVELMLAVSGSGAVAADARFKGGAGRPRRAAGSSGRPARPAWLRYGSGAVFAARPELIELTVLPSRRARRLLRDRRRAALRIAIVYRPDGGLPQQTDVTAIAHLR